MNGGSPALNARTHQDLKRKKHQPGARFSVPNFVSGAILVCHCSNGSVGIFNWLMLGGFLCFSPILK